MLRREREIPELLLWRERKAIDGEGSFLATDEDMDNDKRGILNALKKRNDGFMSSRRNLKFIRREKDGRGKGTTKKFRKDQVLFGHLA